jgi:hypothetical protein
MWGTFSFNLYFSGGATAEARFVLQRRTRSLNNSNLQQYEKQVSVAATPYTRFRKYSLRTTAGTRNNLTEDFRDFPKTPLGEFWDCTSLR